MFSFFFKYFRIKKVDLEVEIKELLQEQKKLKDEKKPQKDIGEFMVRCEYITTIMRYLTRKLTGLVVRFLFFNFRRNAVRRMKVGTDCFIVAKFLDHVFNHDCVSWVHFCGCS
jgi:hypothetical protein